MPPGFTVEGPARVELALLVLTDIGWLAGRGYNIVLIRIPARWRGEEDVTGSFVPVLWESMAEPILTGRDELGWPKIFAEIPAPVVENGRFRAHASWDGFTFLDLTAGDFAAARPLPPAGPMMFHKYVPCTGDWGRADVDYFTVTAPDDPDPEVRSVACGQGHFAFRSPG